MGRPTSFGDGIIVDEELERSKNVGGGSIVEEGVVAGMTESGRAGMASSADEVSNVI